VFPWLLHRGELTRRVSTASTRDVNLLIEKKSVVLRKVKR
jgi:hypothetical protein